LTDSRFGSSNPLASPIYPSAVYRIADLDAVDRISNGQEPGFIYARDGHPNERMLAAKLAELEGGSWAAVTASGMAAIAAACVSNVKAGDRIIASNKLYGRTSQLLKQPLTQFNVTAEFVDCSDLEQVRAAFAKPAKLLIVETISNPLLRVSGVPGLAEIAHRHGCLLLVDNTFASPVLFRPLEHGADLVMESLTKMIGGHSDVTLGLLCGTDPELFPRVSQSISVWGSTAPPYECWLTERSLPTLDLRMRAATSNAASLAADLAEHPAIERVVYPGLASHADFELAKRLLPGGCGNMMAIELKGNGREAVNRFMRQATGIPFCPSLGDVRTTCSHPASTSHRYESPEEKRKQGITDGLLRLSIGIEPYELILAEFKKGLG
jgi:cystathionine gamma-synthase